MLGSAAVLCNTQLPGLENGWLVDVSHSTVLYHIILQYTLLYWIIRYYVTLHLIVLKDLAVTQ